MENTIEKSDSKQNDKELINVFVNKLKNKFESKLYFEYSLNLNDINSIIDETLKEMALKFQFNRRCIDDNRKYFSVCDG